MPAGYSKTPLAKKLGYKEGTRALAVSAPEYYEEILAPLPEDVLIATKGKGPFNLIHFFCDKKKELDKNLPNLRKKLEQNGMIWISWPKKASKVPCDFTEDDVRAAAFKNDLVDIKVCAVDEIWSGLKLVIPVKLRK